MLFEDCLVKWCKRGKIDFLILNVGGKLIFLEGYFIFKIKNDVGSKDNEDKGLVELWFVEVKMFFE